MTSTRVERAIDEIEPEGDEFEPSCDDMRLAWLAQALDAGNDSDPIWSER